MDNSGKEKEALAIMAEADKKMKTTHSRLGTFFGSSSKVEEACDLYVRAGNMFKMAKNWSAAGDAFCKAARLHLQVQSKLDAAVNFLDAGNAFKKSDPQEAVNCFCQVTDIYTDMRQSGSCVAVNGGTETLRFHQKDRHLCSEDESVTGLERHEGRFNIAAKHHISIAEIYETELLDIDKAIVHYEQAADYFKGESSTSAANKCLLKVATYAAQMEQYQKAIEIYEEIGTYSMDTTLLKYGAKDHFFKAALCHFCVDMLNCKLAVQKYEDLFPAFSDARECKLLKKLLDVYEEQNSDAFAEAVREFESITRLDQWQTTMLLRIKRTIQDEENDLR